MNGWIATTDYGWYEFLRGQDDIDEVNFWQPGGSRQFKALAAGDLFLFKLHSPRNFVVGGGVFAHASLLPISLAWSSFGIANGVQSRKEMGPRPHRYRRANAKRILDPPLFIPLARPAKPVLV